MCTPIQKHFGHGEKGENAQIMAIDLEPSVLIQEKICLLIKKPWPQKNLASLFEYQVSFSISLSKSDKEIRI